MGAHNDSTRSKACNERQQIPIAPTLSLPPLGRLKNHSATQIHHNLQDLRQLYFQSYSLSALPSSGIAIPKRSIQHIIHDNSVPDSGYASAEEDEDAEATTTSSFSDEDSDTENEIELLRADPFERAFAIKWTTGFIARSDDWVSIGDSDERAVVVDEATALLSAFIGTEDEDDVALTRAFSFALGPEIVRPNQKAIHVELNDAPLSKEDHTSVGLQSWGSCILFAERICLQPSTFSLLKGPAPRAPRILELGAGTGMLSIVTAKLLEVQSTKAEIVATDYHPDVLANLSRNVSTNFPSTSPISVKALDWEHPTYHLEPFDKPFDVIFAADVIYHPSHAEWIKQVVERLLAPDGAFWLFIPVRTTGRHEGMADTVDTLFSSKKTSVLPEQGTMSILHREEVGRQDGVGRADEGAYKLFKIGRVG